MSDLKWISVKDRMPERMDLRILLYNESNGEVFQGYLGQLGDWHAIRYMGQVAYPNISHWMPLPEPPKP